MERLVYILCGIWFWITRRYRSDAYSEVAQTLNSARKYLWTDFNSRASTKDRGSLLPFHIEALSILERHGALVTNTSRRFDSLAECCKYVTEEFTEAEKAA